MSLLWIINIEANICNCLIERRIQSLYFVTVDVMEVCQQNPSIKSIWVICKQIKAKVKVIRFGANDQRAWQIPPIL